MAADDARPTPADNDPNRRQQKEWLDSCELPKGETYKGKGVSALVLKSVLRAIDSFPPGRAWPSQASIAMRAGLKSLAQCKRAIAILRRLGVVLVIEGTRNGVYGAPTNRYVIDWTEVSRLPRSPLFRGENQRLPDANQSIPTADQSIPADRPKYPRGATNHIEAQTKRTSSKVPATNTLCGLSWREVEVELSGVGLKATAHAVNRARAHQLAPEDVRALIAFFREHSAREDWGPGLLFLRVCQAYPGQAVAAGWPDFKRPVADPGRAAAKEAARARSRRAWQIIRDGQTKGLSEDTIRAQLAAAGCRWEDCDLT